MYVQLKPAGGYLGEIGSKATTTTTKTRWVPLQAGAPVMGIFYLFVAFYFVVASIQETVGGI